MSHRRRRADADLEVTLPITPMLDMTFQLLTFFIFTYHPSAIEGQMDFSLPASGEARARTEADVDPNKPSDTELALKSQITVMLKAQKDGLNDGVISAVVVQTPNGESSFTNLEGLYKFLNDQRTSQDITNKDDIQIAAESKLKYAYVIDAMDTCLKAGFTRVGFAPPPDLTTN
ncbi:MAG: biopolymer transporter ExbD [Gemmataceae bacterium]|nr:biopolymer transporter ExbD [Gemmataceae bacterium]